MSNASSSSYGVIDHTFKRDQVVKAIGTCVRRIDPAALESFYSDFGKAIGRFRHFEQIRLETLSLAERKARTAKLIEAVRLAIIEIETAPADVRAHADEILYSVYRDSEFRFIRDLTASLDRLTVVLTGVQKRLDSEPTVRGRKRKTNRDELFKRTTERLAALFGMTRENARFCAASILEAHDIEIPEDGRVRPGKGRVSKGKNTG